MASVRACVRVRVFVKVYFFRDGVECCSSKMCVSALTEKVRFLELLFDGKSVMNLGGIKFK